MRLIVDGSMHARKGVMMTPIWSLECGIQTMMPQGTSLSLCFFLFCIDLALITLPCGVNDQAYANNLLFWMNTNQR